MNTTPGPGELLLERPNFRTNYADPLRAQGATDEYIAIWADLMAMQAPDAGAVAGLDQQINATLGVEPRTSGYKREHSLLSIALVFNNLEGVRVLLAAGADPNPAGYFFANAALPTTYPDLGGGPDWSTSQQFLELYLDHGGRLDYAMPDDAFPMISNAAATGNFEGLKFLLSKGANPWTEVRGLNYPTLPTGNDRYAIPRMLGGTIENLTFILWFFENDYMADAPPAMADLVYTNLTEGYDVIAAGQTSLDTEQIRMLHDILAFSLTLRDDTHRARREAAVHDLGAYVATQDTRQ